MEGTYLWQYSEDLSEREGEGKATVTRQDVAMAQSQKWFGQAVTVDQGQILER